MTTAVRHVAITGGSSGIGLALAALYAHRGARVSLIARRAEALDEAARTLSGAGGAVCIAAADVCDRAALDAAISGCIARHGPVDLFVACAGMVEPAWFECQPPAVFDQHLLVNVVGVANGVRCVFSHMKDQGRGRILIVSSGAALVGLPGYTAYCASKAALIGLTEALDLEGLAHDVRVSICFPPDTLTPQYEAETPKRSEEARRFIGPMKPWTAAAVARTIVSGLDRDRRRIDFGLSLRALRLFGPWVKPVLVRRYRWLTRKALS